MNKVNESIDFAISKKYFFYQFFGQIGSLCITLLGLVTLYTLYRYTLKDNLFSFLAVQIFLSSF
jgi:hypothetical protein